MAINVFKRAKQLRKAHPKKYEDWQKAVHDASKELSGKKKGKVGAIKIIEKKETTSTRPKHVYQVKRARTGDFKGYKMIRGLTGKHTSIRKGLLVNLREMQHPASTFLKDGIATITKVEKTKKLVILRGKYIHPVTAGAKSHKTLSIPIPLSFFTGRGYCL